MGQEAFRWDPLGDLFISLDIDVLRAAILNATSDPLFNLDGLGGDVPEAADYDFLIVDVFDSGRVEGNLDGIINFDDFVLLTNNFSMSASGWGQGNYNIDDVDMTDLRYQAAIHDIFVMQFT